MGTRTVAAALCALLLAPATRAQERRPAEEALFALRAAFSEGDDADQVDAVRKGAAFADAAVIDELSRGLRSTSPAVREAAVVALGANRSPRALEALHALWGSGWRLRENEELFVLLVRAIGRHGDPSSVDLLADKPVRDVTRMTGAARIASLARIRTRESLLALLEAQRQCAASSRPRRRGAGPLLSAELRAALVELTGVDRGSAAGDWRAWWERSGRSLVVPPRRPEIPREHRARWEAWWGEPWVEGGPAVAPTPPGPPFVRVEKPSAEEVAEAVAGLKAAMLEEDDDAAAAGIEEFAPVDDPAVLALLASGLGWPRPAVRNACVRALGWLGTPEALEALHRFHRFSRERFRDEDLLVLVLRSIGRHGNPASIQELADGPFGEATHAAGIARILGLANIRRRESVEALMTAMATGGKRTRISGRPDAPRFMEPLRLALTILTCQDFGTDPAAWEKWWSGAEKEFQVPRERPDIPPVLRRDWEDYWGVAYR